MSVIFCIKCINVHTCNILSGSLRVIGMEIFDRSFPIFLYNRFHKLISPVSGLGTGSVDRRPVSKDPDNWSSDTTKHKTYRFGLFV